MQARRHLLCHLPSVIMCSAGCNSHFPYLWWNVVVLIGNEVVDILQAHRTLGLLAFAAAIAGMVLGLMIVDWTDEWNIVHASIGLAVVALGLLQVTATVARPQPKSRLRYALRNPLVLNHKICHPAVLQAR